MSAVAIKFRIEVTSQGLDDSVHLHCCSVLPFVPRKGDMIAAKKGDDFREVDAVYWSHADGFEVYFDITSVNPAMLRNMKRDGWMEDES